MFFKKLSIYYAVFGIKDCNKQGRYNINSDALKNFIDQELQSPEGIAVM
jgi:hypothetical protein